MSQGHNEITSDRAAAFVYTRIKKASSVLIILNTKDPQFKYAESLAKSMSRLKKVNVTNDELLRRLPKDRIDLFFEYVDLVIMFGFSDEDMDQNHSLILDLKNSGAATIAINEYKNWFADIMDMTFIARLPGFMADVARLCNRRATNAAIKDYISQLQNGFGV